MGVGAVLRGPSPRYALSTKGVAGAPEGSQVPKALLAASRRLLGCGLAPAELPSHLTLKIPGPFSKHESPRVWPAFLSFSVLGVRVKLGRPQPGSSTPLSFCFKGRAGRVNADSLGVLSVGSPPSPASSVPLYFLGPWPWAPRTCGSGWCSGPPVPTSPDLKRLTNLFYQHSVLRRSPVVPSFGVFQSSFPDIVLKILCKLFKLLLINKCFI